MKEIIQYLLRRKTRTLLTMLAVTVGIFAVTTVGGITEALEQTIQTLEDDALRRITIHTEDYSPVADASLRELRRVPGVAGITENLFGEVNKREEGMVTISVNPESFIATRSDLPGLEYEPPTTGSSLWAGRLPASRTETVITWALAQSRGLALGDTLLIQEQPFTVVGIWEDAATVTGRTAYINYDAAEDLLGENRYYSSMIYVIPQPGAEVEQVAQQLEVAAPEIKADSPAEMVAQSRQQVLIFTLIVGASGLISLLIGTFTIVNTMIVSVQERRQEIGLKKALGADDAHILGEVITEAVLIAGLGGLLGMVGGAGAGTLGNAWLIQQIGSRLFLLTPRLAVGVVAFSAVMGVIAGVYPAWRAAQLDPIVALRGLGSAAVYAGRGFKRLLYLVARNARTILTIGGITIGIFALVLLGSLSEALNTSINNVTNGTQNLFMITPERADVAVGRSLARSLRALDGVQDVILTGNGELELKFSRNAEDSEEAKKTTIWAHESDHGDWGFAMPVRNRLAQGRFFAPDALDELVVGAGLAEIKGIAVGDTLWIKERPFTVVGIWRKIPFDVFGHDNAAFMSLEALSRLQNSDSVGGVAIRAASAADFARLKAQVELEYPGVDIMATDDIFGSVKQALGTLFGVMGAIFSIAVFVGSVSVANTMVIAVNEQVPQIGLKKALGAEDGDILAEVLLDAAKLGAAGGVLGVALAWIAALIINPLVKAQAEMDILHVSPRLVVAGILFSLVLGMAAGLWPARRAARLDPVIALHAE